MKKAAFALSIVSICLSALTLALVVLQLIARKTKYIETDEI